MEEFQVTQHDMKTRSPLKNKFQKFKNFPEKKQEYKTGALWAEEMKEKRRKE